MRSEFPTPDKRRTAMRTRCWTLKNRFELCSAVYNEPSQSSMTMHRFGGSMHAPMSATMLLCRSLLLSGSIRGSASDNQSALPPYVARRAATIASIIPYVANLMTSSSSMNSCLSAASTRGSNYAASKQTSRECEERRICELVNQSRQSSVQALKRQMLVVVPAS